MGIQSLRYAGVAGGYAIGYAIDKSGFLEEDKFKEKL